MEIETAHIAVSKFWRERCREEALLCSKQSNKQVNAAVDPTEGLSPRTRMQQLCEANPAVQKFLRREERKLQTAIENAERKFPRNDEALADLKYRRGTFLESMKEKPAARDAYAEASKLMEQLLPASLRDPFDLRSEVRKSWSPLEQKRDLFLSCELRLRMEEEMMNLERQKKLPSSSESSTIVERIPFGSLTYSEFLSSYARKSLPVIFTGASEHLLGKNVDWTLEGMASSPLGQCLVTPKVRIPVSCEWAQHEARPVRSLSQFIAELRDSTLGGTAATPLEYVVDWSLPQHCLGLLNGDDEAIRMPALCAADWLQDTPHGSLYRDSWPSLFVGPAGTSSGLHTDAFGSNFWMLLVEGRKRWTFYTAQDMPALRPAFPYSFDPVFSPDALNSSLARPFEVDLKAGELLFVPAGSPHAVENLTTTVALSGNYIDESNISASLEALWRDGLTCARSWALFWALHEVERRPGLREIKRRKGDQQHAVSWRAFKEVASRVEECEHKVELESIKQLSSAIESDICMTKRRRVEIARSGRDLNFRN